MLFSKKTILTKGKKPLYTASQVLNASCGTVARCWSHSANKTSALLRTVKNRGFRRAYSSKNTEGTGSSGGATFGLPFYRKLINAWTETPTKWYPLPLAVGALLLVAMQYRKRAKRAKAQLEADLNENGYEVIKLKGPWQVHVIGALPLRNMSRLWGYVNSLELPVWFRPYGLGFYAYAFGCNLDEIEPSNLREYPSLGAFFCRKLKDGARPVDPSSLVSPADGTVLHFGIVKESRVEQVKGITYSLDALLGIERPNSPTTIIERRKFGDQIDASVGSDRNAEETLVHDANVALKMGVKPSKRRLNASGRQLRPGNKLFFSVIYLAPGDYHRFHSPTAWVVEKRRHFVGQLFSVSPYMAKRLENLFVLNERVALLGKWKYGFFGMVPVGATNVGSIKVHFDQALRTNLRGRPPPPGTYTEAVYSTASPILQGQPLTPAEEMGGFCLGSTIVLVFEAPNDFEFNVHAGQKVKVGQRLGDVVEKLKKD